ncbi:MAG: hypothetical protein M0P12_11625 [Paludibacteraceae bacterium]|nr:hypothetical protein [Paludibacteraceae bacterium]MCK9616030.1 hypothetical protein [Candidatus Omnitrophota bacterium]
MKEYPHIQGPSKAPHLPCIGFYKYDGSNIRIEWSRKKGWHKYGTRHQMIDRSHEVFGTAVDLFHNTVAPKIDPILKSEFRNCESFVAFCEFFGPNSFAGTHIPEDTKVLKFFDINVYKKGILSPKEFVNLFGNLDVSAKVVYVGDFNQTLISNVRENTLETPLNEGVVCKGGSGHNLWMAKIKTQEYLNKLYSRFGKDWEKYAE